MDSDKDPGSSRQPSLSKALGEGGPEDSGEGWIRLVGSSGRWLLRTTGKFSMEHAGDFESHIIPVQPFTVPLCAEHG